MLILTRKPGQAILLGGDIELIVTSVEGDQVKIGIRAPRELTILRKEVADAIRENNQEAAASKAQRDRFKNLLKHE